MSLSDYSKGTVLEELKKKLEFLNESIADLQQGLEQSKQFPSGDFGGFSAKQIAQSRADAEELIHKYQAQRLVMIEKIATEGGGNIMNEKESKCGLKTGGVPLAK